MPISGLRAASGGVLRPVSLKQGAPRFRAGRPNELA